MTRRDLRQLALLIGTALFGFATAYFAVQLLLDGSSGASLPRLGFDLAGFLGDANIAATMWLHREHDK